MTPYEIFKASVTNGFNPDNFTKIVLDALSYSEITDSQINEILQHCETQEYFSIDSLDELINVLNLENKLSIHKDALTQMIEGICYLSNLRPIEFVLCCVISSNGKIRAIGRHLFDHFDILESEVNILKRSLETQARFALSLSQSISEPERHIRHILILFNSPSEMVRGMLVEVMWQFLINYFGLVTSIFIDLEKTFNKTLELERFKEILNRFKNRFNLSTNCQELHSVYFFPEIYEIAQRECSDFMQDKMREMADIYQSPIRRLFRNVQLGRGGGWRRSNGEVLNLAKISVSKHAPTFIFSMTPIEEIEFIDNINKNWDEIDEANE